MDGSKRDYQPQKRTQHQRQFRPRFHQPQPQVQTQVQPQPQPQPQPQVQTQVQTQPQPQPQPQVQTQPQTQTQVQTQPQTQPQIQTQPQPQTQPHGQAQAPFQGQAQAQEQNRNNYITRGDLEEVLNKFKDELKTKLTELKTEIDKLKADLTRMIGHVYEVALVSRLPSIIQNCWELVPVYDGSYRLYRRNKTNEKSFLSLENKLSDRPKLAKLGGRSLTNIQEIEINFLQPYIQNNKTLKSIQMSPTKQKPFTDVPINTLVIAEATVSPLGFEYRSEPRKLLLIKLSQLEVQIEFLMAHYNITEIDQFRVLLVSPTLKGAEWKPKLRELLEYHQSEFKQLILLFKKDFFVMVGI